MAEVSQVPGRCCLNNRWPEGLGLRYVVDVADMVDLEIEIEIGSENSLEIEINW
jgi:hypothetical protein